LYDDLEIQKAAESADKALQAYERSDLSAWFDAMVTAWTLRILALVANAEQKKAQIELNLLLPVGGKATFDPNVFTPDFIAQVKGRRAEMAKKSTLGFAVEATPTPARVFVDGTFRGVTPVELTGLSPGDHFLTLVAPGYQIVQKRFRPAPGAIEHAMLEPAPGLGAFLPRLDALRRDLLTRAEPSAAGAMARELGVDQILVLVVTNRPQDLRVSATRIGATGAELATAEELLPRDSAKLDDAAANLFSRVLAREMAPSRVAHSSIFGMRWTMRHTGYVLLGAGVGLAGTGGMFGLQAKGSADSFRDLRDLEQANPVWKERESEGRAYALVADLSYLVAALLVAAGTSMVLLDKDGSTAVAQERRPAILVPGPVEKTGSAAEELRTPASKEVVGPSESATPVVEEKKTKPAEAKAGSEEPRKAKAEEKRKAEEEKKAKAGEEKRLAEERRRSEAEEDKRRAAEDARRAEEAEERRVEEERAKKAAEEKRLAEQRRAEQEKKKAEEAKKREEYFDDLRDDD
ncbi:MAG: PEGA domain-containing protein, partial [Deltaproteobacteria bacterium]|nr:PEGA domain-containing protein [Deltaproteobacteria bacterium]